MRSTNRIVTAALVLAFVATTPLAALAAERDTANRNVADITSSDVKERPAPSDRPVDRITDRPKDRTTDRITDRPTDRPIHRCAELADNPRRCLHDRPTDHLNIRQLIWRLIHAHEWKKLVRLLHYLGWV